MANIQGDDPFVGGGGNIAGVTVDKQLVVMGEAQSSLGWYSQHKKSAYSWFSSFTTGGADNEIISIKNTSSTHHLHIDHIQASTRTAGGFTVFRVASGTSSGTTITGRNLGPGSGLTADATSFGDAAVAGSLTGDTIAHAFAAADQPVPIDLKGAAILGQNDEVSVSMSSASAAVFITIYGYYKAF